MGVIKSVVCSGSRYNARHPVDFGNNDRQTIDRLDQVGRDNIPCSGRKNFPVFLRKKNRLVNLPEKLIPVPRTFRVM